MRKPGFVLGGPAVAAMAAIVAVGVASADDHDFEDFARREGCDSVVFNDRRDECKKLSEGVNRYCKTEKFDCNKDDFRKVLDDYNDTKNRSTYNDDEAKAKSEKLDRLRKILDDKKAEANRGLPIAKQCVQFRNDIFDHFKKTAELTETSARQQMDIRQKLLDRLKEADAKRDEAKRKRDASPDDENLKREYEKASEEYRKVEQELGDFNAKNGKDIERNYKRLVEGYEKGNQEHKTERENQENRRKNCEDITNTSY